MVLEHSICVKLHGSLLYIIYRIRMIEFNNNGMTIIYHVATEMNRCDKVAEILQQRQIRDVRQQNVVSPT